MGALNWCAPICGHFRADKARNATPAGETSQVKISSKIVGQGPIPTDANVLVNISVELDGPIEQMTISVLVPNNGTESEQSDCAMRRAKSFAHQFANFPG
jgi:hypothetical protein